MKIYTKTGDKGISSLWGGERISKSSLRMEAYGTVDELNSVLGIISGKQGNQELKDKLLRIQKELMVLGSDLATPENINSKLKKVALKTRLVELLETEIDLWTKDLPELKSFILPSGGTLGSLTHYARTICRRAERTCVRLAENENINPTAIIYLNRLSDWLFTLARYQNKLDQIPEQEWHSNDDS